MKKAKLSTDEKTLRAQLSTEIQNKKQCTFDTYKCTQLCIDSYDYCPKHILSDKNAPYKQCTYIYPTNGKKCHLPAAKNEKKEVCFCNDHAFKNNLATNRKNAKCAPTPTAESILNSLSHYIRPLKESHSSQGDGRVTKSIDPIVDIDASAVITAQSNEVLEFCSESESDIEPSTYLTVWHDIQLDSSDNESIDSEEGDPLKHANVYTAEEVSLITKEKLARLQSLYIEQYRYLQYVLKEKRRKYVHALKREKETCCNIYSQVHDNPKEQRLYEKLKQYKKYHRTYGPEAILAKKLKEMRAKASDVVPPKPPSVQKCAFTEGGVKCGEKTLPLARHCRKHILEDQSQVLFKTCGKMIADLECPTPVEAIFDDSPCQLHMEVPILRAYDKPRKDSESDQDDTLELPPSFAMPNTENVKTELMDYSMQQEIPKMETLPTLLFEESADSMAFNNENQHLDTTGSENMDVDVTDISSKPEEHSAGQSIEIKEEDIKESNDSGFLAGLCILDDSKLEELDKKWMNLKKVTSNEIGTSNEITTENKEEFSGDVACRDEIKEETFLETEDKKDDEKVNVSDTEPTMFKLEAETDKADTLKNASDHESYSKPSTSLEEIKINDETETDKEESKLPGEEKIKIDNKKTDPEILEIDGEDVCSLENKPEQKKADDKMEE